MENQKVLSAFSYLSVFIAPFVVPLVVYFVSKDSEVKRHSIRALISHLIPLVLGFIFFAISKTDSILAGLVDISLYKNLNSLAFSFKKSKCARIFAVNFSSNVSPSFPACQKLFRMILAFSSNIRLKSLSLVR